MSAPTSNFFQAAAVRQAAATSRTQSEAIEKLGQRAVADNFRRFQEACVRYDIEIPGEKRRADGGTSAIVNIPRGAFGDAAKVRDAITGASSRRMIIRRLGLADSSNAYRRLAAAAKRLDFVLPPKINDQPFKERKAERNRMRALVEAGDFRDLVELARKSRSVSDLLLRLGLDTGPLNYKWIRALIGDETPQDRTNVGALGIRDEDFFVLGTMRNTGSMRKRIVDRGLIPYGFCAGCGMEPLWQGQPITFQLDHVNGDTADNRLENLRFLCPNCHSQTDTYCKPKKYLIAA